MRNRHVRSLRRISFGWTKEFCVNFRKLRYC
nr:MAG TPA: hypothetical protein [Caudoviricetes sp.]